MPIIEYNIEDSKSIQGKVDNIKQKKDPPYLCPFLLERVQFVIIFFSPSKVQSISIKTHKTEKLLLYFITPTGQQIHKQQIPASYQKEDAIQRKCNIDQNISRVKVVLTASEPKKLGLSLLIFRSPSDSKPSQTKITNFSKNAQFDKSPHSAMMSEKKINRQIFDKRIKPSHQTIQKQVKNMEQGFRKETRKSKQKQQEQLKRAMRQSLKDGDKTASKKQQDVILMEQQEMKNYEPAHLSLPLIQYNKNQMEAFKYVSQQWLEAQKRLQSLHRVDQRNRLSNQITIRIFHNKSICFDIYGQERTRLTNLVQELGAKVVDEPVDFCWLIANKTQTQRIAKAKKLKGVKVVRSQYISDCVSTNSRLDQKDYLLKL